MTGDVTMTAFQNDRPPGPWDHIQSRLDGVAAEEGVVLLYAAESGSRAWGFASPDSDYDVRFIYMHPRDWYLSLAERRDVIERPLDAHLVDLAGWDLRKAMRLLLKSNPAFYEWLVSPIVYREAPGVRVALRTLFEQQAEPGVLAHAYHSIATTQWRSEIEGREAIKLKRYFYAVRPLLSLQWVLDKGSLPPMNLGALLRSSDVPLEVRAALDGLLALKRSTPELGRAAPLPVLNAWIEERLQILDPQRRTFSRRDPHDCEDAADRLFRQMIGCD